MQGTDFNKINTFFTCGYIVGMIPSMLWILLRNDSRPTCTQTTWSYIGLAHGFGCLQCKLFGDCWQSGELTSTMICLPTFLKVTSSTSAVTSVQQVFMFENHVTVSCQLPVSRFTQSDFFRAFQRVRLLLVLIIFSDRKRICRIRFRSR